MLQVGIENPLHFCRGGNLFAAVRSNVYFLQHAFRYVPYVVYNLEVLFVCKT